MVGTPITHHALTPGTHNNEAPSSFREVGAQPNRQRLLELEGARVELVVHALLGDQVVVATTLDDAAMV